MIQDKLVYWRPQLDGVKPRCKDPSFHYINYSSCSEINESEVFTYVANEKPTDAVDDTFGLSGCSGAIDNGQAGAERDAVEL